MAGRYLLLSGRWAAVILLALLMAVMLLIAAAAAFPYTYAKTAGEEPPLCAASQPERVPTFPSGLFPAA